MVIIIRKNTKLNAKKGHGIKYKGVNGITRSTQKPSTKPALNMSSRTA